jgi:hypothetical protein
MSVATFRQPSARDGDVDGTIRSLIEKNYPDLLEAEVTIGAVFAHAKRGEDGEVQGEALKHHGWPAAAIISINPHRKRVEGLPDVSLAIDGDRWPDMSDEQRTALLHHEIHHLLVCRDDEGVIRSDDCGRPKLKMRPHDWECSGFETIIRRYGQAAIDTQIIDWGKKLEQRCFAFAGAGRG